jgi:hypothetical protein
MYLTLRHRLTEEITSLMDAGVIVRADAEKLADTVISLLEGYDYYRCLMPDTERFDELGRFLKERAVEILRSDRGRPGRGR